MHRASMGFLGLMMLCSSLPACGSSPTENVVRTDQELEVFNWWTNPGETDALQAILKMYSQRYFSNRHGKPVSGPPPERSHAPRCASRGA